MCLVALPPAGDSGSCLFNCHWNFVGGIAERFRNYVFVLCLILAKLKNFGVELASNAVFHWIHTLT